MSGQSQQYQSSYYGSSRSFQDLAPCTITVVLFFGSVIFTSVSMLTKSFLAGDMRAFRAAQRAAIDEHERISHPIKTSITSKSKSNMKRIQLEMSFISIYTLLHHLTIVGCIIFIVYIIEYHPPFPDANRLEFDADMFVFLILLCVIFGIFSIRRNTDLNTKEKNDSQSKMIQKKGMKQQKRDKTNCAGGDNNSISVSSTRSYDEVVNMQHENNNFELPSPSTSMTRRRFTPNSDSSIKSDELVSLLEIDINNAIKGDTGTSINKVQDQSYSGKKSSAVTSLPVKADDLLEEIALQENKQSRNNLTSSDSDVLADLPILSPNRETDLLNIYQSLELKGFMTVCFLLYQFANAYSYESKTEVDAVTAGGERDELNSASVGINHYYNISRIFVTAFLFLTGYGHVLFFDRNNDYSMNRLIQVLFRMNFCGMLLCLALGKPYIYYKACWLHTYFFLLTYVTMKWNHLKNHTWNGLRLKMAILAIVIFLLWDYDSRLWSVHVILFGASKQAVDGAPYGQIWEFYFRAYLHHWAFFIGMMFAINHPVTSLLLRKLEAIGSHTELLFKSITGALLIAITFIWGVGPFESSKYVYNATNPYFGMLPIICFIYFRNINPTIRSHHIEIFKSVGVYSLEIYLLHHHLFISDDGTMKKIFIPGYPSCNLLISIWLIMIFSKALRTSSSVVITMITSPSHNKKEKMSSGRNVIMMLGTFVIFHSVAIILQFLQMIRPEIIATATIICGVYLYQTVMDLTMADILVMPMFETASISSLQTVNTLSSPVSRTSPPIIGTVTILLFCLLGQIASMNGSNKFEFLPPICSETVNDGSWVPINACSDYQQGRKARDFNSRLPNSKCHEDYQWGWSQNGLSSRCQFRFVPPVLAQRKLKNKNIVFIGDTMTRNLFFAVCRALGDESAGLHDEKLKVHSEITKKFGSLTITFKWAPLVTDILTKFELFTESVDLIVAGSGAWDKLHLWATDQDQKSHISSLRRLARELQLMKDASIPVIWFTPTTINTQALVNEDKRKQMNEASVEEMRQLYAESGINAASAFVLQGHTFTRSQAHQSFDGIHYPPQIYDVGAQIMLNALDWLLVNIHVEGKYFDESFQPKIGTMANPSLGLMILGLVLIGLLFHDGFFGLLYITSIFVHPTQIPTRIALFYSSNEHRLRYSFNPSNLYAELHNYMAQTQAQQQQNRGEEEVEIVSKNGSSKSNSHLSTISE